MSDLLSVRDAARRADASEKTVRRWIKSGKVRALLVGGAWQVLAEDLVVDKAQAIARSLAHTNGATPAMRDLAVDLDEVDALTTEPSR